MIDLAKIETLDGTLRLVIQGWSRKHSVHCARNCLFVKKFLCLCLAFKFERWWKKLFEQIIYLIAYCSLQSSSKYGRAISALFIYFQILRILSFFCTLYFQETYLYPFWDILHHIPMNRVRSGQWYGLTPIASYQVAKIIY